jgi:hypothetical protein
MNSVLTKLGKLRDMDLTEVRERGAQEFAKFSERWLGSQTRELTDRQLLRECLPAARRASAPATAAALLAQLQQARPFFPALAQRAEIVRLMEARFPAEREQLIARANRVLAHRFDIFEHEGLRYRAPQAEPSTAEQVDWRLEPLSGKRTPLAHWSTLDFLNPAVAGDKKFTWELNRHQFFVTLGQAYWLTGEERYAEQFVALATSWLDANPPKRGINWASSLELALRVISWLWALHLFADARAVTPEFTARLLKSLIAQGRYIETYLSHYFSPNTHLTGEALGLFYLGTALPELRRAAHWRQLGLRILLEQLPLHVRGDGVYFEQASYYHRYTTDFYTHLLLLSRAHGSELPALVAEKLAALHEHLLWITRPDGSSTFYGDDDGGRLVMLSTRRAADFRDTLATGAALLQRGDWKFVAGAAAVETLWLLGPDGLQAYDELAAFAPAQRTKAFAESGFYVLRDGWSPQSSYMLIDCGLHGVLNAGHAHSDALSFEFAAGGTTWLVDPGTFTYTGDLAQRNAMRSSLNHNTVSVDGLSQSTPKTAFTWEQVARCLPREFRATESTLFFAGQQDGYTRLADAVRQQRAWLLQQPLPAQETPLHLLMTDRFNTRGAHRYECYLHFAAGCRAEIVEEQVRVRTANGAELRLAARLAGTSGTGSLQWKVREGWVSRCYGQRAAAPVVSWAIEATGTLEVQTLLVPLPPRQLEQRACVRFIEQWLSHSNAGATSTARQTTMV